MKTNALLLTATAFLGLSILPVVHAHGDHDQKSDTKTGEVIDVVCYVDHGATGAKHEDCAKTCISSGLPVGLKTSDGIYLLVGDHKPINAELAPLAAKTITVKGKIVEKDGVKMIENAEIIKK